MFMGGLEFVLIARLFAEPVQDPTQPERVDAPITAVHTPSALDDNDVAQFIIEGEFPNTCYTVGRVLVRARTEDLEMGAIQFHLEALKTKRQNCLEVKTPYLKTVDLGILPPGQFQIVSMKDQRARAVLNIVKAENRQQVDNYNYAPVDAMYIRDDALGFRRLVVLIGSFTNSCMKFASAVPVYRAPNSKVIEILPIVEMKKDQLCLDVLIPFFQAVEVPEDMASGKYLFHVRTMNGNSLNKVDTIKME